MIDTKWSGRPGSISGGGETTPRRLGLTPVNSISIMHHRQHHELQHRQHRLSLSTLSNSKQESGDVASDSILFQYNAKLIEDDFG